MHEAITPKTKALADCKVVKSIQHPLNSEFKYHYMQLTRLLFIIILIWHALYHSWRSIIIV